VNLGRLRRVLPSLTLFLLVLLVSASLVTVSCKRSAVTRKPNVNLTATPLAAFIGDCKIDRGTQCPGADLSGADLGESWAGKDRIRRGADLKGANFEGANLSNTKLLGIHLEQANLRKADLTNAYAASSYLYQADFSDANLTGADFSYADVDEVKTEGAIFCNTKWTDLTVRNDSCPPVQTE